MDMKLDKKLQLQRRTAESREIYLNTKALYGQSRWPENETRIADMIHNRDWKSVEDFFESIKPMDERIPTLNDAETYALDNEVPALYHIVEQKQKDCIKNGYSVVDPEKATYYTKAFSEPNNTILRYESYKVYNGHPTPILLPTMTGLNFVSEEEAIASISNDKYAN